MKQNILDTIRRQSGETVPPGYFDSVKSRIKLELPDRKWEYEGDAVAVAEAASRPSWWIRIRPYAYMAAMFAGVYLMMNMSTLLKPTGTDGMEPGPMLLAALDNDMFVSEYVDPAVDDYDLYDNLYDAGFDPSAVTGWTSYAKNESTNDEDDD